MRQRPSARLLVLNTENEVLLFRFEHKAGPLQGRAFWATPGGGLENGETFQQAARRELLEETGIQIDSIGEPVWRQEITFQMPSGERVLAEEQFFLVRISSEQLSQENWTLLERELIADRRWWSICALNAAEELVFPENLSAILQAVR